MLQEHWDWLKQLPFGVVIFSKPAPGMKPIPVHISKGDLDGDRYFVCCNTKIMNMICAESIRKGMRSLHFLTIQGRMILHWQHLRFGILQNIQQSRGTIYDI